MSRPIRGLATVVAWLLFAFVVDACMPLSSAPTALPASPAGDFVVSSTAFGEGANIPPSFTCSGRGVSPELKWSGAPANTKSLTLIVGDPDAPSGTFTHWVAFDIPVTQNEIAEGALDVGKSGKNGTGRTGYAAPCPPSGTHRYIFTLTALDVEALGLGDGASRADVEHAMVGHIIAQAQTMGRYSK